jgi:hypothetical protein
VRSFSLIMFFITRSMFSFSDNVMLLISRMCLLLHKAHVLLLGCSGPSHQDPVFFFLNAHVLCLSVRCSSSGPHCSDAQSPCSFFQQRS